MGEVLLFMLVGYVEAGFKNMLFQNYNLNPLKYPIRSANTETVGWLQ